MVKKTLKVKRSIRSKIVLMVTLLLVAVSFIIGGTSYFIAKSELEEQGKVTLKNTVNMIMMLIDAKNDEVEKGVITMVQAQEEIKSYILGQAEKTGKTIEVSYNQQGDKKKINEIKRSINKDIDLGENGYPIIYSSKGMEIAHPSLEGANIWNLQEKGKKNGKYLAQEQIKAASKKDGGFVSYYWTYPNSNKIGEKITFQKTDPNWGWIVIAGTYMSDFNKGANQILMYTVIVALLSLVVGIAIALLIVRRIVKPIHRMVEITNELSEGDFREKERRIKNKDEIGLMSAALVNLMVNVREMLQSINTSAGKLHSASEELTASAEQSAQASAQVAGSANEVASASERQLHSAEEADTLVGEISDSMKQVLDETKLVNEAAKKTAETANDGEAAIGKVITQMQVITEKTNETSGVINDLEAKSKQIGEIVDVITGISEQTNLLALNASIEAARAGESGKGFSVVAQEVGKLAEQSNAAAKQIAALINEVQNRTQNAVIFMDDGRKEVEEGTQIVSMAGKSFQEITDMVKSITGKIQKIYHGVEMVTDQTNRVVTAVEDINEETRKTSGETQTISAATQEQSASAQEIAAASENLASMAEELQRTIDKFQI